MKQGIDLPGRMRKTGLAGLLLLLGSILAWSHAWSQESSPAGSSSPGDSTAAAIHELQQQVNELRSAMAEMRSETDQYRAENAALRHELHLGSPSAAVMPPKDQYQTAPLADADPPNAQSVPPKTTQAASLEDRVASLEESAQLLSLIHI